MRSGIDQVVNRLVNSVFRHGAVVIVLGRELLVAQVVPFYPARFSGHPAGRGRIASFPGGRRAVQVAVTYRTQFVPGHPAGFVPLSASGDLLVLASAESPAVGGREHLTHPGIDPVNRGEVLVL